MASRTVKAVALVGLCLLGLIATAVVAQEFENNGARQLSKDDDARKVEWFLTHIRRNETRHLIDERLAPDDPFADAFHEKFAAALRDNQGRLEQDKNGAEALAQDETFELDPRVQIDSLRGLMRQLSKDDEAALQGTLNHIHRNETRHLGNNNSEILRKYLEEEEGADNSLRALQYEPGDDVWHGKLENGTLSDRLNALKASGGFVWGGWGGEDGDLSPRHFGGEYLRALRYERDGMYQSGNGTPTPDVGTAIDRMKARDNTRLEDEMRDNDMPAEFGEFMRGLRQYGDDGDTQRLRSTFRAGGRESRGVGRDNPRRLGYRSVDGSWDRKQYRDEGALPRPSRG